MSAVLVFRRSHPGSAVMRRQIGSHRHAAFDDTLRYDVIQKLDGKIDPDKAMDILKHEAFTSPRGPISIDPETRDIVQIVYLRRVEKVHGELRSVELSQLVTGMTDPGK